MTKFDALMQAVEDAKIFLEDAQLPLHSITHKVLEGVGIKKVSIERVYLTADGERVVVDYAWSSLGCFDSDSKVLPKSLFDSDDPLKAAQDYQASKNAEQAEKAREEKVKTIKRLQEGTRREVMRTPLEEVRITEKLQLIESNLKRIEACTNFLKAKLQEIAATPRPRPEIWNEGKEWVLTGGGLPDIGKVRELAFERGEHRGRVDLANELLQLVLEDLK